MLRIEQLYKRYAAEDGRCVTALDGVSLEVATGELIVLMGPNGSGKSTLLKVLSGQVVPDAGAIRWATAGGNKPRIAYVPQDSSALSFPEMTLAEHLLWEEMDSRAPRIWRRAITPRRIQMYRIMLQKYGVQRLVEGLEAPLSALSAGWQQIFLVLAAALRRELRGAAEAGDEVMLLDEPTSALDLENTRRCLELIRRLHEEGRTILAATHSAETAAALKGRLIVLRRGRLAADVSDRLLSADEIRGLLAATEG